jgi:chorismate-pyruvate lyase
MDHGVSASQREEVLALLGVDAAEARLAALEPEALPEPQRRLLVHQRDMTRTLERFCDQRVALRVLHWEREAGGDALHRRVLLVAENGLVVEYGAIRIHLARFHDAARTEILQGRSPLGTILHEHVIAHRCEPQLFLRLEGGGALHEAFGLGPEVTLYGRFNWILDRDGALLAEVAELLPPFDGARGAP